MIGVQRTNTILYCDRWDETVAFYRDRLGLTVTFDNEWFVELALAAGAFVSIVDATRSSIRAGDGRGITLSWQVDDVSDARSTLAARGVETGEIRQRFGQPVVDLFDPAGNRIELWSRA